MRKVAGKRRQGIPADHTGKQCEEAARPEPEHRGLSR